MSGVIVHEWLSRTGGSENVFEVLGKTFPDAARFCLWNESDGRFTDVEESALARSPLRGRKSLALPVMPLVWRRMPSVDADWVLASSHAFAHHVRFSGQAANAPKLVYTHTPARYVWEPALDRRGGGPVAKIAAAALKPIDRKRAQEPVAIAANSKFIAERIRRSWGRDSDVIYPPVDVARFARDLSDVSEADAATLAALPSEFLLGVSRLVTYKRLDRTIRAGRATGMPVVIAGEGPAADELRRYAAEIGADVTFVGRANDEMLARLYTLAAALVFAPIEDFGIIPVEAMACGTPVIANAIGGAAESVQDSKTGAIVSGWSDDEVRIAVDRAMASRPEDCVARATEFGVDVFKRRIRDWVCENTSGLTREPVHKNETG